MEDFHRPQGCHLVAYFLMDPRCSKTAGRPSCGILGREMDCRRCDVTPPASGVNLFPLEVVGPEGTLSTPALT